MGIFKKTIKYSKPSIEIDNKIEDLNEGLNKTKSTLSEQKISEEEVDEILSEEVVDIENWREIFDEETISEYEQQIDEVREKHNDLIRVQGSLEYAKNKEVKEIFSELYQGEVERVVDTYVSKYSNDIINLREDLFHEIKKEPVVDLRILEEKINLLTLKYNQLSEGLLNEPSTGLEDPVTFEQLKNHYQLLVGRLQEQLSTLGGGGEVRLQYLDDIVGIATNAAAYDGKFLKYNHSLKKFEFVTVSGSGGGISLTDLSVTTNSAGTAAFSYNNSNGVFTYTPPSFVGYATEGYVNNAVVGFITTGALSGYATEGYVNNAVAGVSTFSGNYNDLSNTPTIPTNVGDLTNNVGFITSGSSGAGLTALTGASAGTYGNSNNTPQITVDANGRITGISQIGISGGGGISGVNIFNSGTSVGLTTNLEFRNNVTAVSSGSTIYVDVSGVSTANIIADTLSVSGISTFNGKIRVIDDVEFHVGTNGVSGDYKFYFDSGNSHSILYEDITGREARFISQIPGESNAAFHFFKASTALARFSVNAIALYSGGNVKLETTASGINVIGHTETDTLNVSGLSTFVGLSTFAGGLNVTGISTFNGNVELPNNRDIILGNVLGNSGNFKLYNGANEPFEIFGSSKETYIRNAGSNANGISISANGSVTLGGGGTGTHSIHADSDGTAKLYGSGLQKLRTDPGGVIITGICTATSFSGNGNDIVHSTWTLGANGSSHYTFTGPGGLSNTDDPKIYLARGQTYEFVNNSGGSHPFQIQQSNGSAYSTGVTNNGASSGTIRFEVPFSAPNTLQYKCTSHSSMGNTIIVYPDISP